MPAPEAIFSALLEFASTPGVLCGSLRLEIGRQVCGLVFLGRGRPARGSFLLFSARSQETEIDSCAIWEIQASVLLADSYPAFWASISRVFCMGVLRLICQFCAVLDFCCRRNRIL